MRDAEGEGFVVGDALGGVAAGLFVQLAVGVGHGEELVFGGFGGRIGGGHF